MGWECSQYDMVGDYSDTQARGNVGMFGVVFLENTVVSPSWEMKSFSLSYIINLSTQVLIMLGALLTTGIDQTAVTAHIISM